MRGQQIIQRCDPAAPWQLRGHLQPFGMLVEHRIDDVDEGLVAVEQPMPSGQQIPFQPALALMLAEHFQHLATDGEELVVRLGGRVPLSRGRLEHGLQTVGDRFVGSEYAEIAG